MRSSRFKEMTEQLGAEFLKENPELAKQMDTDLFEAVLMHHLKEDATHCEEIIQAHMRRMFDAVDAIDAPLLLAAALLARRVNKMLAHMLSTSNTEGAYVLLDDYIRELTEDREALKRGVFKSKIKGTEEA